MLKQTHFLALDEARLGNAKKLFETLLPGISAAAGSAVKTQFPASRHSMLKGGSKLCR